MPIKPQDQMYRRYIESAFRAMSEGGGIVEMDTKHDIRSAAIESILKVLDAKIANLQEGEGLAIDLNVEIVGANGKVRGGSGSQRNMPEYIEWRKSVYERDGYKCVDCGSSAKLNAHHIKQWAHYPSLRFDVSNGETLCGKCHATRHPHLNFYGEKAGQS